MRLAIAIVVVVLIGGAATAVALVGATDESDGAPGAAPMAGRADSRDQPLSDVRVAQILQDPAAFEGAEVIVRAASAVPIEPAGGFVLEDDRGRRILVHVRGDAPELPPAEVAIRGEVVRFTEPAAEQLGDAYADAKQLVRTPTGTGDPYLLFRAVAETDAGERGGARGPAGSAAARSRLAEIARDPDRFYGDAVTVAGDVVRAGRRAFVAAADGRELLIVPQVDPEPELREALERGAAVRAQGLVERVPAAGHPTLVGERALLERYDGEPSLAATSVTVLH